MTRGPVIDIAVDARKIDARMFREFTLNHDMRRNYLFENS